jgi:hypothetical protein
MTYDYHGNWENKLNYQTPWHDVLVRQRMQSERCGSNNFQTRCLLDTCCQEYQGALCTPPPPPQVSPPPSSHLLSSPRPPHQWALQNEPVGDISKTLDHYIVKNKFPAKKLNLGLGAYGRSWKVGAPLGSEGVAAPSLSRPLHLRCRTHCTVAVAPTAPLLSHPLHLCCRTHCTSVRPRSSAPVSCPV